MEGKMIDAKVYSMLKVNECGSFAAAAKQLSITGYLKEAAESLY